MDILEVLLALALWLVFAFLGWKKKAAQRGAAPSEPGWLEVEGEAQAAPSGSGEERRQPFDFRDLIRQLREGWLPPEISEEPPPPTPVEFSPPPPPPRVRVSAAESASYSVVAEQGRRRSLLGQELIRDLTSGRASLARAVLLSEVLGPPVALRRSGPGRDGDE